MKSHRQALLTSALLSLTLVLWSARTVIDESCALIITSKANELLQIAIRNKEQSNINTEEISGYRHEILTPLPIDKLTPTPVLLTDISKYAYVTLDCCHVSRVPPPPQ